MNRPSLDVVLTIRDRACGSTLNVALRKAIRVDITGCRSTITAQVDDNVGDDDHPATMQIFGSDSDVDVHTGHMRAFFVGPVAGGSSILRVAVDTASVSIGAAVQHCADCAVAINGTISGGFSANSNSNLTLGLITLGGEVGAPILNGNSFATFGGISATTS